jgi:ankyrin repeat protein
MLDLATVASRGDLNRVRAMVNRGAFIDARTTDGWTALHHAVFNQAESVVRFLVASGANCNAITKSKQTPLHIACTKPDLVIILLLLEGQALVNPKDNVFSLFFESLLSIHEVLPFPSKPHFTMHQNTV